MDAAEIDVAGASAESIAQEVRETGNVDFAFASLENTLAAYINGGGNVDDAVPGGDADGVGFGSRAGTGRSLWQRYVNALRDDICTPGAELNQLLRTGAGATGTAVVVAIMSALGISMLAAPVIATVAGILLALGVKTVCEEWVDRSAE